MSSGFCHSQMVSAHAERKNLLFDQHSNSDHLVFSSGILHYISISYISNAEDGILVFEEDMVSQLHKIFLVSHSTFVCALSQENF